MSEDAREGSARRSTANVHADAPRQHRRASSGDESLTNEVVTSNQTAFKESICVCMFLYEDKATIL